MASFLDLESSGDGEEVSGCASHFAFGCELNSTTRSFTFQVNEEDDSDHSLVLSTVCLTASAKDECNIVELVGRDYQNKEIIVPVANLKSSCLPMVSLHNFELEPPVTFRLRSGSGPVHLSGRHQIFHRRDLSEFSEEEELSEEDESVEEEEELSPIKPAKKQRSS
ncbi:nucleoplasmin-3 [Anolis carolinensis]|uniref:Nucleophosmin/nucleoplasmin 3 n=1 Tax=Anolis carolinensis TaxID=28377 RepID=H9GI92_ANOCA|nr:PREDICTED: nucleoplasmin-3 [Anolis carolinensis]|eukprot:XP_003224272.1 PREDICTED: nucleoplasmin-3 [Anolis carolinensis]